MAFLPFLVTRFVKNPCGLSFYGFEILCESSGSISVGNPLTNITKSRWMMERNRKFFAVACYPTSIRFFRLKKWYFSKLAVTSHGRPWLAKAGHGILLTPDLAEAIF